MPEPTVANYWEVTDLKLDTASVKNADKKDAAGVTAQVKQLQADLIALGYLTGTADGGYGPGTTRAVLRFQRHAARAYRMPQPDAGGGDLYTGAATGTCDHATALAVRKWIDKRWKLPLNRFQLTAIGPGGKLRSDAAAAWDAIVQLASSKGGTLEGPYGDTARAVRPTSKVGASLYSFHYCGLGLIRSRGQFAERAGRGIRPAIRYHRFGRPRKVLGASSRVRVGGREPHQRGPAGPRRSGGVHAATCIVISARWRRSNSAGDRYPIDEWIRRWL
jgi:peptidoglycan hydrolase-like protein with peptidoglycan-binding domain